MGTIEINRKDQDQTRFIMKKKRIVPLGIMVVSLLGIQIATPLYAENQLITSLKQKKERLNTLFKDVKECIQGKKKCTSKEYKAMAGVVLGIILALVVVGTASWALPRYVKRQRALKERETSSLEQSYSFSPYTPEKGLLGVVSEGSLWAESNMLDRIKNIIAENPGIDINIKSEKGKTSLHLVVKRRHPKIVKYLLDAGADPNTHDDKGNTPLHVAASEKQLEIVKYLLDTGANPNTRDDEGNTPLHVAASKGEPDIVKDLLKAKEYKQYINAQNAKGETPLYKATRFYFSFNEELVRALLDAGADPTIKTKDENSPLYNVFDDAITKHVKLFLDKGADANMIVDDYNHTPLILASFKDANETAQILLDHGADPDAREIKGRTPLHIAIARNNEGLFDLLIKYKADLNVRNSDGFTPLQLAIFDSKIRLANKLIDSGADLDVGGKWGTPLYLALRRRDVTLAHKLLDAGARPALSKDKGTEVLHLALKNNNYDIAQRLVDLKVNVDTPEIRDIVLNRIRSSSLSDDQKMLLNDIRSRMKDPVDPYSKDLIKAYKEVLADPQLSEKDRKKIKQKLELIEKESLFLN